LTRNIFILVCTLFLGNLFSQNTGNGIFNLIYLKDSPEFKDLTLEQNYQERARLKIREIIKIHYTKGNGDSIMLRNNASAGVYVVRNFAVKYHYFYNEAGILYKKAKMPLNFKITSEDSVRLNNTESIWLEKTNSGYDRKLKTPISCGITESYQDGKLMKIGKTGVCAIKALRIRAVENGDTSYIVKYDKILSYDEKDKLAETEENYGNAYAHISTTEKYERRKIIAERKHKTLNDSITYSEINETKLNRRGQVRSSKYYSTLHPNHYTSFKCKYDLRGNLDRVYMVEHDQKHKRTKFVHYYYYYERNKVRTVEFSNLKGEIYVEFDDSDKFKKVTITETGEVITYEYLQR
jgi:hypothetical protein